MMADDWLMGSRQADDSLLMDFDDAGKQDSKPAKQHDSKMVNKHADKTASSQNDKQPKAVPSVQDDKPQPRRDTADASPAPSPQDARHEGQQDSNTTINQAVVVARQQIAKREPAGEPFDFDENDPWGLGEEPGTPPENGVIERHNPSSGQMPSGSTPMGINPITTPPADPAREPSPGQKEAEWGSDDNWGDDGWGGDGQPSSQQPSQQSDKSTDDGWDDDGWDDDWEDVPSSSDTKQPYATTGSATPQQAGNPASNLASKTATQHDSKPSDDWDDDWGDDNWGEDTGRQADATTVMAPVDGTNNDDWEDDWGTETTVLPTPTLARQQDSNIASNQTDNAANQQTGNWDDDWKDDDWDNNEPAATAQPSTPAPKSYPPADNNEDEEDDDDDNNTSHKTLIIILAIIAGLTLCGGIAFGIHQAVNYFNDQRQQETAKIEHQNRLTDLQDQWDKAVQAANTLTGKADAISIDDKTVAEKIKTLKTLAVRNPMSEDQLEQLTPQLQQATTRAQQAFDQYVEQQAAAVQKQLAEQIDKADKLNDAPDSNDKTSMQQLAKQWKNKTVDEGNLQDARGAKDKLTALVATVQKAKDDKAAADKKAAEEKKQKEEEEKQQQEQAQAQQEQEQQQYTPTYEEPQYTPQYVPQYTPQSTPQPQPTQQPEPVQPSTPEPSGNAGVHL